MALQEWLLPEEEVKYTAPGIITYMGSPYRFYITNERVLLHANRGMFFPKEDIITERLVAITSMSYKEQGFLPKIGVLQVETKDKSMKFGRKPEIIKAIWQTLQKDIRRPQVDLADAT